MNQQYFRFYCILYLYLCVQHNSTALMWFSLLNELHEKYICFLHFPCTLSCTDQREAQKKKTMAKYNMIFFLLAANSPTRHPTQMWLCVLVCLSIIIRCMWNAWCLLWSWFMEWKGCTMYICEMNTVENALLHYYFRREVKMLKI